MQPIELTMLHVITENDLQIQTARTATRPLARTQTQTFPRHVRVRRRHFNGAERRPADSPTLAQPTPPLVLHNSRSLASDTPRTALARGQRRDENSRADESPAAGHDACPGVPRLHAATCSTITQARPFFGRRCESAPQLMIVRGARKVGTMPVVLETSIVIQSSRRSRPFTVTSTLCPVPSVQFFFLPAFPTFAKAVTSTSSKPS
jgi:hypothetical protein